MMKLTDKTKKNIRLQLLGIWGILSILICAGEDTPGQPMSDALFFGSKTIGIASLYLCFKVGQRLNRKGLLPDVEEEENEEEEW